MGREVDKPTMTVPRRMTAISTCHSTWYCLEVLLPLPANRSPSAFSTMKDEGGIRPGTREPLLVIRSPFLPSSSMLTSLSLLFSSSPSREPLLRVDAPSPSLSVFTLDEGCVWSLSNRNLVHILSPLVGVLAVPLFHIISRVNRD